MDEHQLVIILVQVKVVILALISLGAFIYAIPLCFVRRFHKSVHILSLNVCIAAFMCSSYWIFFFIMNTYYQAILWTDQSCLLVLYLQTVVNCQVLYSLCVVSLNRLFTIVYHRNGVFQKKMSLIGCITGQWLIGFILPLPSFGSSLMACFESGLELSYQLYTLFIIAVIPAISLLITNGIIMIYARRSSQRVRPMNNGVVQASVVNSRDVRLLKHMVFMFVIFFCGWVPIYIVAAIDWQGTAISYVSYQGLTILPAVSLLIDVGNLFLYNYELRAYLGRRFQAPILLSQTH